MVWLEKEALVSTVQKWVKDLEIPIGVNRGYNSWTNLYDQVQHINSILKRGHKKVVIFYLGDLDPSGVDMDRHMKEALVHFGLQQEQVEFRRLALTELQVEQHNLPPRPEDAETLAKLQRDPRMKNYDRQYIVEIDALLAYAPEEFRRDIVAGVNSVWDEEVYNDMKANAEVLDEEAKDCIGQTIEEAKTKIKDYVLSQS
jgi:hypothetical protein